MDSLRPTREQLEREANDLRRQLSEMTASRDRFRDLTESTSDWVWEVDRDGIYTYVSPQAKNMLGREPDDLVGTSPFDTMPPAEAERVAKIFQDVVSRAEPFERLENVCLHADGHEIVIETNGVPIFNSNGDLTGYRGVDRDITDRKRAEEAMQHSQKQLQALTDNSPVAIAWANMQGDILYSNKKFRDGYGYELNEMSTTEQWFALAYPDPEYRKYVLDKWQAAVEQAMETGCEIASMEVNVTCKDGSVRRAEVSGAVLPDRVLAIFKDITDRKLVEKELKETTAILQAAMDCSTAGIAIANAPDGKLRYVNNAGLRIGGRTKEEIAHDISIGDYIPRWRVLNIDGTQCDEKEIPLTRAVLYGETCDRQLIIRQPSSEDRIVWASAAPILNEDGEVVAGVVVFPDITDLKRAQDALEKRLVALTCPLDSTDDIAFDDLFNLDDIQRLQDQFAQAADVASIITQTDGTPITAPSNFCRLCMDLIRKTEIGCANCFKSDAILGRHNPEGPTVQQCMSGGLWDAGAGITVGGRHIANWLIGQVRDETQTEENMRKYAREIGADEEDVAEAFREVPAMTRQQFDKVAQALFTLANQLSASAYQNVQQAQFIAERKEAEQERNRLEEQLRQAQKMEAVGQLAGGIAHDFNNILTAIMGNAELLKMSLPSASKHSGFAGEIIKGASRAADLTKQLLAFARKGKWRVEPVDIHNIIAQTAGMLTHSIDRRIEIRLELHASPCLVTGDPTQLQNAMLNIGVNARDAMPDGGTLTYATSNRTLTRIDCDKYPLDLTPGEFLEINITDTGRGMDKETQKRIFEPFFTTKGVGKGTGLGLAGVYGCIINHDGRVSVYSEPGHGSTFKIMLPLTSGTEPKTKNHAIAGDAPPRGTGHVLIVDDEESIRNFVWTSLENLGYEVSACADGAAGVDYYRKHHREIDLVLLDLIMPKMSGQDVFTEMQKVDPNVKVLISSGFSHTRAANQMLDQGALALLNKPFQITELAQAVAKYIRANSGNNTSN